MAELDLINNDYYIGIRRPINSINEIRTEEIIIHVPTIVHSYYFYENWENHELYDLHLVFNYLNKYDNYANNLRENY